jgi:hypothetical protein
MMIRFEAKVVDCAEALGGDILQVTLDSVDLKDEVGRQSPYVLLGQCFEFSGRPTLEWHDGADYDGGAQIHAIVLKRDSIEITTDMTVGFCISLSMTDAKHKELTSFLKRIFPNVEVYQTKWKANKEIHGTH